MFETLCSCSCNNLGSFWSRNEGPIISSVFALFVALIIMWLTAYLQSRKARINKKKEYRRVLALVHIQLYFQLNYLMRLKGVLQDIKIYIEDNSEFPYSEYPHKIDHSVFKEYVVAINTYSGCDQDIVVLLSAIEVQLRELNVSLDFNHVIQLVEATQADSKNHYKKYIEGIEKVYTEQELLRKIKQVRSSIEKEVGAHVKLLFPEDSY